MSWPKESIELWSAAELIPMCMKCGVEYSPTYEDGYRTSNKCITCTGGEEVSEPFQHRQRIVCTDGFSMSVQAGDGLYSSPRKDGAFTYTNVEVGFPSEVEELLMPHIEQLNKYNPDTDEWDIPENPTKTVYPYTPASVILAVIAKHGGMVSGELPPLKMTGGEEE